MIAIPTIARKDSEVTRNAVIFSPDKHVKVSIRSPKMVPGFAIVDPEKTRSIPPSVTTNTWLDALALVIEAYTSRNANPIIDVIAREGII